jgi:hypothetical protein
MTSIYQKFAVTSVAAALSIAIIEVNAKSVQAAVITNGSLEVTIRDDNGAIDAIIFNQNTIFRSDFFNPGTPVSDFGFQNGTNEFTFVRNTTTGFPTEQPVNVVLDDESVIVTGTYTGGGANVSFTRTYSLVSELNALLVRTDFVNNGSEIALRYFDTFDPDQGIDRGNGFETFNDVFTLDTVVGSARVGQATELGGLTVVFGSLESNATVGTGFDLDISNGSELNNFFDASFDPNGAFQDIGIHIGAIELLLGSGGNGSFEYLHGYGESPAEAQEQFISAASVTSVNVPEPSSLLGLLVAGAFGSCSFVKREQKQKNE